MLIQYSSKMLRESQSLKKSSSKRNLKYKISLDKVKIKGKHSKLSQMKNSGKKNKTRNNNNNKELVLQDLREVDLY